MSAEISSPVMQRGAVSDVLVTVFDDAGQKMEGTVLDMEYSVEDSGIITVDETAELLHSIPEKQRLP